MLMNRPTRNGKMCSIFTTVLLLALCLWTESTSFGQGIVDFENFNNTLISTHNGATTGLMSGPAGTYYFALLDSPNQTTAGPSLSGWGFQDYGYNTTTPGLMNGNYTTDPGVDIQFNPPGSPDNFVVVGWSANIGTSYGLAQAWWNNGNPNSGPSGYFGISSVATDVIVGGGSVPVPTIFGPTVGREVQGFTLNYYAVPEPSSFALASLAGAALFISRRRKRRDHARSTTTSNSRNERTIT
jgi:hypothetical protein